MVWAQMIEHIAGKDIRHIVNRTPFFGTIVSRAQVTIVRSIYVDLPGDVAKSHPTPRNDGDGIQVVVDVVEVLIHLSIRTTERCRVIGQTRPLDPCRVLTWELNQFAHAGFPIPVSDALLSGPLYPKLSTCFEGARLTQLVQLVTAGRLFPCHEGRVDL